MYLKKNKTKKLVEKLHANLAQIDKCELEDNILDEDESDNEFDL